MYRYFINLVLVVILISLIVGCGHLTDRDSSLKNVVSLNQPYINLLNQTDVSFTISNAEVGFQYRYVLSDTNATTNAVVGSGNILTQTEAITGIDTSILDDGMLTFDINVKATTISYSIKKDTIKPTFTGLTISPPAGVAGTTFNMIATTGLAEDIVKVDLSVVNQNLSTTQEMVNNGDRTHSYILFTDEVSTGAYQLIYTGIDDCGNTSTASTWFRVL